jgi:hypothetical protein
MRAARTQPDPLLLLLLLPAAGCRLQQLHPAKWQLAAVTCTAGALPLTAACTYLLLLLLGETSML